MRTVPRSVSTPSCSAVKPPEAKRGLEAGAVAGRDRQRWRRAPPSARSDWRTVISVTMTSRTSVLAHIAPDAGVVVRLGVKRSGTGRQQQGREQYWFEHRWKMDRAWRRVNARPRRVRAQPSQHATVAGHLVVALRRLDHLHHRRNRGSRMIRRNGSGPSDPSPISSCRSRREPNGVLESLRWRQRRSAKPMACSQRRQTPS